MATEYKFKSKIMRADAEAKKQLKERVDSGLADDT